MCLLDGMTREEFIAEQQRDPVRLVINAHAARVYKELEEFLGPVRRVAIVAFDDPRQPYFSFADTDKTKEKHPEFGEALATVAEAVYPLRERPDPDDDLIQAGIEMRRLQNLYFAHRRNGNHHGASEVLPQARAAEEAFDRILSSKVENTLF